MNEEKVHNSVKRKMKGFSRIEIFLSQQEKGILKEICTKRVRKQSDIIGDLLQKEGLRLGIIKEGV